MELIELSVVECVRRLGRGGLGRVAVSIDALPAIFPINYAMDGESVMFRTGPGTKLSAALRQAVVAFEIDGHDRLSHTGWSVFVVGLAEVVAMEELPSYARLELTPWAGGERDHLVRISPTRISGRELRLQPPLPGGAA